MGKSHGCPKLAGGRRESPLGKAIRRPHRRGGVNGVSDWEVECLRSIMVEALLPDIIRIKL